MFLLDVTLPGVSSPPSKSPGQVLQSSIPTIAIGALMTVIGGGALWKGVGSTGRILPYLRWVLAIGGPLVAASGFMPGSSSGPGLPPLPATPAVTTHPAEPLNLDDEAEIEPSPRPRPGIFQSVKNFFFGTGTNELLENLLSGDIKGGKLIKELRVFLNSSDFSTRKKAACAMVQNAYGEDGSGSLASTANSFLGIALLKDSDNAIVEGILEGLTGLEVCREAAPALKELQSILGETGEAVDFKKDLGVTISKRRSKPAESTTSKRSTRAEDLGIDLRPPIMEEVDDTEPASKRKRTGLDLHIDASGKLAVGDDEDEDDSLKKKTSSSSGSSSTGKGKPKVEVDDGDSGSMLVGLDDEPIIADSDVSVSGGSKSKSKPIPDSKKVVPDGDPSIFEVDFEVPPLDDGDSLSDSSIGTSALDDDDLDGDSLDDSSSGVGLGSGSGVIERSDEEDSDFDRLVGFAEEDAEETKEASRKGSSSTPIKKEEEKDIFDDDDFDPSPSLDSDSVVIEDPSGEVDEKDIFDDDDFGDADGSGSVVEGSSSEFELDLSGSSSRSSALGDDSGEVDLTGARSVEDSDSGIIIEDPSEVEELEDPGEFDLKTPESIASDINKDFKKLGYSATVVRGKIVIEKGKDRYSFSHIDDEGDLLVIDQRSGYECFILKRDGKVVAAG